MLGLLLVVAMVGCTPAQEGAGETASTGETEGGSVGTAKDDIVIGCIYRDMTQTWFIQEGAAAEAMGAELGIKVIVGDSKEDPSVYTDVLDNFIGQGVDGLIINICDQQLSQMTVNKCAEAGIPVMGVDIPLIADDGTYLAPSIELDGYLCGQQMSNWLCDYLEDNAIEMDYATTGFMVLALDTLTSCVPRADGQYDTFVSRNPDFPADNIIRIDYGSGSTDEGYNAAAATITAHPEITTWYVVASNDEGAQGATRALEQADLDKKAIVVGLGGYMAKDEFRKEYSCFIASAYIQASTVGNESVKAMYENIVNGTPIFEEYKDDQAFGIYPFGAIMVTQDNFEEVMGEDAK